MPCSSNNDREQKLRVGGDVFENTAQVLRCGWCLVFGNKSQGTPRATSATASRGASPTHRPAHTAGAYACNRVVLEEYVNKCTRQPEPKGTLHVCMYSCKLASTYMFIASPSSPGTGVLGAKMRLSCVALFATGITTQTRATPTSWSSWRRWWPRFCCKLPLDEPQCQCKAGARVGQTRGPSSSQGGPPDSRDNDSFVRHLS